ncbi:MAG: 50S ribosomal protein L11 [Rhodobacteraceae bacterium]|nr:50S ribosomal protein L11 [Paracoccaceae bacterium]
MAKKLIGTVKLQVKAGQANPSPPVGPALGQRGINIMAFVKEFNAKTAQMEPGTPTPVVISYYQDKSFTMAIKSPPASYLIRKAAKVEAGSKTPGRGSAGAITAADVRRIAEAKMKDLNTRDVEAAMQMVVGSARSMGIEVKG